MKILTKTSEMATSQQMSGQQNTENMAYTFLERSEGHSLDVGLLTSRTLGK